MTHKVSFPALLQDFYRKADVSFAIFPYSILRRFQASVCSMATALAFVSGPVAAEEILSAQMIVNRAVERAEIQDRSMIEANFQSEAVTESQSLDGNDKATDTETSRYRQYPLNGAVYEELVEIDGRPLNEKEIEKEEKKKRDFIREIEERRTRGDYIQPVKEERIRFNRDFTERYLYKIEKTEEIRGHPCWAISFKPREGKLPARNRMDRALNQMTGILWIARDDFGLVRVEFALREPFRYWGGFLAVIRKTDGWVDYTKVDSNVWLPLHFSLKLDLRVMMIKNIRRLITKDWFHYSRVEGPPDTNHSATDDNSSPPSREAD